MDEQDMDIINNRQVDLDAEEAMADHERQRDRMRMGREKMDAMRQRASDRMDAMQRRAVQVPLRVVSGAVGSLPVQTREHLRQSARESVLAVQSFVDAVSSAGLMTVDRIFADPRTPQETAQPRRIVIEREDTPSPS